MRARRRDRTTAATPLSLDVPSTGGRHQRHVELIDSDSAVTFPIRGCRHHPAAQLNNIFGHAPHDRKDPIHTITSDCNRVMVLRLVIPFSAMTDPQPCLRPVHLGRIPGREGGETEFTIWLASSKGLYRRSQPCRPSRQRRAYASALPIHCAGATLQCHRRSTSNAPRCDCAGVCGTLRRAQARRTRWARAPYAHTRGAQAALMPGARSHRTPHSGRRRRLGAGDESAPPRHHRTAAIKQIRSHVGGFGVPHVRVRQAQFGKLARYAAVHAPGLEGAPEPVDRRLGAGLAREPEPQIRGAKSAHGV